MANDHRWCFSWTAGPPPALGANRAAMAKAAMWNSGDIITVSFLDGDPSLQERVRQAARGWIAPGLANLKLDFRSPPNTMIRISFKFDGSWSTVGTTCKQVTDKTRPTMNYGWLTTASTDEEIRGVVLHEFGHALGLIHEHQSPVGGIKWNREAVIDSLSGPPNNWTIEQIEFNVLDLASAKETKFSEFDQESIMLYPFPASWTKDGFSSDENDTLSATDKSFIKKAYP